QVASSEWEDYYRDGVSDPVALDRRLVVVEAATGKTVTQVLLEDDVLSGVDWLDFADILVWYEGRPGDYPWLRALRPGSEPGDAWNVVGPDHVPDLESACCVVIHGRSRDGLVVTSAVGGYTEVWTVSEDGASHQGTLPSFSAADVDANGRFALLNYVWENDGEAMAPVLDIHDIHGGNRERAWTGRSRPSAEEWFE
ncbi:MAG: hypothetical protein OEV43_09090, partial [Coriobacteriia bacterium]|nr:hypothetical protein [Coriobacteriia bacterium]